MFLKSFKPLNLLILFKIKVNLRGINDIFPVVNLMHERNNSFTNGKIVPAAVQITKVIKLVKKTLYRFSNV